MTDNCEVCDGRSGVPGNENIVEGLTVCDYCHAAMVNDPKKCAMCGNFLIAGIAECDCCEADEINPEEGFIELRRGKYIGSDPADRDQTALIKVFPDHVTVQFDHFQHPKSHFWHRYPLTDWELFPEPNDSTRVG